MTHLLIFFEIECTFLFLFGEVIIEFAPYLNFESVVEFDIFFGENLLSASRAPLIAFVAVVPLHKAVKAESMTTRQLYWLSHDSKANRAKAVFLPL